MAKMVISEAATQELLQIVEVYRDNAGEMAAEQIATQILDKLELLEDFPQMGILPRDAVIREGGFRYLIVGKYLCIYRVIDDLAYVYHIVHGASNYSILFKELVKQIIDP